MITQIPQQVSDTLEPGRVLTIIDSIKEKTKAKPRKVSIKVHVPGPTATDSVSKCSDFLLGLLIIFLVTRCPGYYNLIVQLHSGVDPEMEIGQASIPCTNPKAHRKLHLASTINTVGFKEEEGFSSPSHLNNQGHGINAVWLCWSQAD